ncbi:hypothetical protein [Streptomyces sp. Ag109_G2-15]|uniref:hypothetical protein n=1 Tax=Streptomyces sp. Ag109_G2-15 TaxID=1938850 RepID=UPI0011814F20|nr:hypothetical protein [Streptomyces sp. Ag109_G2-15]
MASVTDECEMSEAEAARLPVDVEKITEVVDRALGMSISTSKRTDIDTRVGQLTGMLSLLKGQCLGEDEDSNVLRLLGLVDRHLALNNRPTARSQAHEAFFFMQDAAMFTRALLTAYIKKNEVSTP